MAFLYKTQKIAGLGDENVSSKVATSKLNLSNGESVAIVLVVLVSDSEGKADVVSKDVMEIIFRRVEEEEISLGILALLESSKESALSYISGKKCQVSFKTLLFYKDACFISSVGEEIDLWLYDGPKSSQVNVSVGSGKVSAGQLFLLGSKRFFETFDVASLEGAAGIDLDDVVDGLATELNVMPGKEKIAAAFVRIVGDEGGAEVSGDDKKVEEGTESVTTVDREEEMVQADVVPQETGSGLRVKFLGLFDKTLTVVFWEVKKLLRGDIKAVFRLKRNLFLAGIVLFLFLLLSITFTFYQRDRHQNVAKAQEHLTGAKSMFDEGSALISLNKERARSILLSAKGEVNVALSLDKDNEEAKILLSDIEAKLRDAEIVAGVNFSTFFEGDAAILCLALSPKNLIVVSESSITTVDLVTKKSAEESDEIGGENCSFFDNKVFTANGDKVRKLDLANDKQSDIGKVPGGLDLGVFIGNVYLLKRDGIVKIVPTASGYSEGRDYLNDVADFTDSAKFAIDGSIWVASGDKIKKFLRGEDEGFSITGVSSGTFNLGLIYTNENLDDVFVVDKLSGAVLIIGKDGVYKRALQSAEFGRASDVLVTDDGKKLYVASGNKVFEASLE